MLLGPVSTAADLPFASARGRIGVRGASVCVRARPPSAMASGWARTLGSTPRRARCGRPDRRPARQMRPRPQAAAHRSKPVSSRSAAWMAASRSGWRAMKRAIAGLRRLPRAISRAARRGERRAEPFEEAADAPHDAEAATGPPTVSIAERRSTRPRLRGGPRRVGWASRARVEWSGRVVRAAAICAPIDAPRRRPKRRVTNAMGRRVVSTQVEPAAHG